jgi:LPXTG-motif cell wall-anchored protein
MEMDSHTMIPPDLAPGMVVRAEFKATEDDAYYAKRIVPIRGAVVTNHDMAVLETAPLEQGTPITEVYREEVVVSRPVVVAPVPVAEPVSDAAVVDDTPFASDMSSEESLPQTASQQPLMALLALLSLGAAGAVSFVRRRGSI